MKRSLAWCIALSLAIAIGVESAAKAYSTDSVGHSTVVQACKGDKDDDCKD